MSLQAALFTAPVAGLVPYPVEDANRLLQLWDHNLGPCKRLYEQNGWALMVDGVPVSVAISASTVSATVNLKKTGRILARNEVVELARQASDPAHRWATRPMLRLWREVAAQRWESWPVKVAISYSDKRHRGDMYRWDGWTLEDEVKGSSGGGQWSTKRDADHPASGPKRLWSWTYPACGRGER